MTPELFHQYATLKQQIADLEARAKELQPLLLVELASVNDTPVEMDEGIISVTHRKKWTYTDAVKQADAALKGLKAGEEASGAATYTEDRGIMFKPKVYEKDQS